MKFCDHMRCLRGNLTQTAFCKKLGIPLTTYQRYEKGERVPDIDVLSQISRTLGVSCDLMLGLPTQHTSSHPGLVGNSGQAAGTLSATEKDKIIAYQTEIIDSLTKSIDILTSRLSSEVRRA